MLDDHTRVKQVSGLGISKLRITFAVPFVNLTGGIRVVLGYANWLADAGHDVEVVYPLVPYPFHFTLRQRFGELRKGLREGARVDWHNMRCRVRRAPVIAPAFMRDADVIVATSWPVVETVGRLPARCGKKIQLLFHHESGTGPEDRIVNTYRLPFHRIAFARAVGCDVERRFGCRIDDVIPAGVDHGAFFPSGERQRDSVLMLYHNDPRKGAADGIEALSELRQRRPQVNVRMCGTVVPSSLPAWVEFTLRPTDAGLRGLFSTATVLLYPSRYEGFGLPPLEAMACGCPVVATRVGAVPDYAQHGVHAWLVEAGDVPGMVEGLDALLSNEALRNAFSCEGIRRASEYSMSRTAPMFAQAIDRLHPRDSD